MSLCLLVAITPVAAQDMSRYGLLTFFPQVLDASRAEADEDEAQDEDQQQAEDEAALAALGEDPPAHEVHSVPDNDSDFASASAEEAGSEAGTDISLTGLADFEQALETLQESARAFDQSQLEYYTQLGYIQQSAGRHDQAIRYFNDALQLIRVNDGLFSLAQEPLFLALTESHLALGQFTEADDMQASLYFLAQRGFDDSSERRSAAERRWADWQLDFFRDYYLYQQRPIDIDHTMNLRISRLHDRGVRSLNAFERQQMGTGVMPRNFATHSPRYLTPQSRRLNDAEDLYEALVENRSDPPRLDDVERLLEIYWLRSREAILSLRRQRFMTEMHPITYQDIIQMQRMNYQQGIRAINAAREAHAQNDATWAELSLYLADWHLLFGYPQRAQSDYLALYQRLHQQGWAEPDIESLLAPSPAVSLPSFVRPQFHQSAVFPIADAAIPEDIQHHDGYFDVEVDIFRDGSVRRFRSQNQSEGASGEVRAILRDQLQSSLFRPALSGGQIAPRSTVALRYYYQTLPP